MSWVTIITVSTCCTCLQEPPVYLYGDNSPVIMICVSETQYPIIITSFYVDCHPLGQTRVL